MLLPDLLGEILYYLSPKDTVHLAQTNKELHHFVFKENESKHFCDLLKKFHQKTTYLYTYELEDVILREIRVLKNRQRMSDTLLLKVMSGFYRSDLIEKTFKDFKYQCDNFNLEAARS